MTFVKIALVGAFIAVMLGVAKQQHWFQRAGIVGRCQVVSTPFGQTGQWWSCSQGILTGFPTLERDQCDSAGFAGKRQLWRCPEPIDAAPAI